MKKQVFPVHYPFPCKRFSGIKFLNHSETKANLERKYEVLSGKDFLKKPPPRKWGLGCSLLIPAAWEERLKQRKLKGQMKILRNKIMVKHQTLIQI